MEYIRLHQKIQSDVYWKPSTPDTAVSIPHRHMKTDAEVDFEITVEDMETLKKFKKIENYGANSGSPVYGGKL